MALENGTRATLGSESADLLRILKESKNWRVSGTSFATGWSRRRESHRSPIDEYGHLVVGTPCVPVRYLYAVSDSRNSTVQRRVGFPLLFGRSYDVCELARRFHPSAQVPA